MQKYKFNNDGGNLGCHPFMEPEPPVDAAGCAEFYLASEVDARIAELEQQLAGANATIALFMGPDGEQHIERFAAAVRSLMESGR